MDARVDQSPAQRHCPERLLVSSGSDSDALWFSANSEVPLYRQLVTQVQLAILSGELRHGDRLPSTRELARRFAIHPNTVSAGYRELVRGLDRAAPWKRCLRLRPALA